MKSHSGFKLWKLIVPIFIALVIALIPAPDGLSTNAWLYFAIFVGLIIGLILEPIPPALIGIVAIVIAVVLRVGPKDSGDVTVSAAAAINWGLSGFSNAVVWLIFAAFTIGVGFQKTGLGERAALYLVSKLGKSTLGLGYAIAIVDTIFAPFIPSNAARSGGTVYPIVTSIATMLGSTPEQSPRRIGAYLVWIGLAASCVSSSIFLTGQAPNPLALSLIAKSGVPVVDWIGWFLAFLPIGIILFIITPLVGYYIFPPDVKGSTEITKNAAEKYTALGGITKEQLSMLLIAIIALVLWVGSSLFGINATTTALIVIILMIATGTITWNDFLNNKPAWATFIWFATLVAMAGGLSNVGFLTWLSSLVKDYLTTFSATTTVILLMLFFSWLRYFFASGTAYVTASIAIFVTLAQAIPDTRPEQTMLLLCLPMGFMGIITPYGTGCSPLWFGSHFIQGTTFFLLGGIFAMLYMVIYLFIGLPWIEFIMPYLNFHL